MIITKERNVYPGGHLKVETYQKVVPDTTIRTTPAMMIHRREVKIYSLKKEREQTFKLIQYYQKVALTTDDDVKARQTAEYIDTILRIDLNRLDREIKALNKEIEQIKNR
jgi:hypothetical protein